MKKRILLITIFTFLVSCSPDNIKDCFSNPGETISTTQILNNFTKLNVSEGIEVEILQATNPQIEIQVGKNLKNQVQFDVSGDQLFLKNNLKCSLGTTKAAKIIVSVPNLTHINSLSQFEVKSNSVLNFPELTITHGLSTDSASGIISLNLNSTNVIVETNNLSQFNLSGVTENLTVNFWGGNARIHAFQLQAQNINILHRSTNHMYLNPIQSIQGHIYGIGNVYLNHTPPTINVTTHYTGQLIF